MSILQRVKLVQIKFEPGKYVKGKWVEGERHPPIPFMGTAQSPTGEQLELLPDGGRGKKVFTIFAPIELKFDMVEPREERSGDIIVHEGEEYVAQVVKPWKNGLPTDHWELIVTRDYEKKEGSP